MPNTLAHIAIQVPSGYVVGRWKCVPWVLLGCIIPDFPWILRRIINFLLTDADPFELVQYATVQASLLFCLIICAGIALLTSRWGYVMAILALNCLIHLLLDAVEIKRGNGVHFFAPWSWDHFSIGWVWPEDAIITVFTAIGFCVALWMVFFLPLEEEFFALPVVPRVLLSFVVLSIYLLGPIALMQGPFDADNHSIKTLKLRDERIGRPVLLDRRPYVKDKDGAYVVTLTGERLKLVGQNLPGVGRVSVTGFFVSENEIEVHEIHRSQSFRRDIASIIGLFMVLAIWLKLLWKQLFSA